MSFNIPGYFLDQKTKKLFKIQPHGPFSLKELKKRLREEEEQEAAAASTSATASTSRAAPISKLRSPTNLTQFLRQRATLGSLNNCSANVSLMNNPSSHTGIPFLMTQLRSRSKIELEGPPQRYNRMLVDLTSFPDFGEAIISYRPGKLARFGYQVNPEFQMWNAGQEWSSESGEVWSLQFGTRNFMLNGQERRTIVGTSDGKLWRYSVPKLPSLSTEDLTQQFLTANGAIRQDEHIIGYPSTSYIGNSESSLDCLFTKKKDLFFSSSIDDQNDHIVVGGDQALYRLSSTFDLVSFQKVRSSIFSTHLPSDYPYICWSGARNGTLQLTDFRQNYHHNLRLTPKFKQSSSITQIQKLAGYELLTTGMDGSVNIWDTRQPKRSKNSRKRDHSGYKEKQQEPTTFPEPIRRLKGHVNESSQHLGFDIDLENNLLMLSGTDGRVRIWSIFNSSSNEPIWCSQKYDSPIPAAKFMLNNHQYPQIQTGWSSVLDQSALTKNYPGILLFGVNHEHSDHSAIQWLTGVK